MKAAWQKIKKYPIMLLFFAFIGLFALVDTLMPDRDISQLENRPLQQAPPFNWQALLNNEWTLQYGEYTKDQFLWRDEWITGQSLLEAAQGKLESGGVWFAEDGYQIAKDDVWSATQQTQMPKNTQAVRELAARHPGEVDVMVVPSPANVLRDMLPWNPPQIDENAMLDSIFAEVEAAGGNPVDLRGPYADAKEDTQLFYRTDHHWTTLGGAQIAYLQYCELRGVQPQLPPEGSLVQAPGFRGTNYAKTKRPGTAAETLDFYDLQNPLTIYRPQGDVLVGETVPLMQREKLHTQDMYGAFIWGNNGYSELEGNGTGSVLVIKDSYGNCFVPYLIENYAKIGIVDLRGWTTPIDETYTAGGFDSMLVLYSFDTFTQDQFIYRLQDASQ